MKSALLIPGGGMRNAYTSGILCGLKIKPKQFDAVFAISSGAPVGAHFISGQITQTEYLWSHRLTRRSVFSRLNILRLRWPVNVDEIADESYQRFDFKTFDHSPTKLVISVFRRSTGKTEFIEAKNGNLKQLTMATCSLQPFARPIRINGDWYVDGGEANLLPIEDIHNQGYRRILILLNLPSQQSIEHDGRIKTFLTYPIWPKAKKAQRERKKLYEKSIAYIKNPPNGLKTFLIEPSIKPIHKLSRSRKKVKKIFHHGMQVGTLLKEKVHNFLTE